jgi:tetratricopeptide (TPR) repeat protein
VIWYDRALDALKQFAEVLKRQPVSGSDEEALKRAREQEIKRAEQEVQKEEERLLGQESLWLNGKDDPFRAIAGVKENERFFFFPPNVGIQIVDRDLAKAFLARRLGLYDQTMESLKNIELDNSATRRFDQQVCSVLLRSQLLTIAGRPVEAHLLIREFEEKRGEDLAKRESARLQLALLYEKNKILLVLGRFTELEENLTLLASALQNDLERLMKNPQLVQMLVLQFFRDLGRNGLLTTGWSGMTTDMLVRTHPFQSLLNARVEELVGMNYALEESHYRLAMIYLEQGANAMAAFHFHEVLKIKMHAYQPQNAQRAQFYLGLLGNR